MTNEDRPADPYHVGMSNRTGELLNGKVLLVRWEVIEGGVAGSPEEWVKTLRDECVEAGIDLRTTQLEKPRMTLAYNKAFEPSEEFVHACVAKMELDRWVGSFLPSKKDFLNGRP